MMIIAMKNRAQKDKRRTTRTVLDHISAITCSPKIQKPSECHGTICNISSHGTKFASYRPYRADSIIDIGLLLLDYGSWVETRGRVLRCEQKDCDEYHIALEFKNDDNQKNLIAEYIEVMKSWKRSNESAVAVFRS
jgi:hypothetical protein